MIRPGPTARKAWDAILTGARFAGDVLAAPGKGAAATLRYVTTGEEPRLKAGSSWQLEGPGLGEMAAQGYGLIGEEISKSLFPGYESVDTSKGRQAAEAIMSVPFGVALEGVGQAGLAQKGLTSAAQSTWRMSPLARGYPGLSGMAAGPAARAAYHGAKAEYGMGKALGDELGQTMMREAAGAAVKARRLFGAVEASRPFSRVATRMTRMAADVDPRYLEAARFHLWPVMTPGGGIARFPTGLGIAAKAASDVVGNLRRGLEG